MGICLYLFIYVYITILLCLVVFILEFFLEKEKEIRCYVCDYFMLFFAIQCLR